MHRAPDTTCQRHVEDFRGVTANSALLNDSFRCRCCGCLVGEHPNPSLKKRTVSFSAFPEEVPENAQNNKAKAVFTQQTAAEASSDAKRRPYDSYHGVSGDISVQAPTNDIENLIIQFNTNKKLDKTFITSHLKKIINSLTDADIHRVAEAFDSYISRFITNCTCSFDEVLDILNATDQSCLIKKDKPAYAKLQQVISANILLYRSFISFFDINQFSFDYIKNNCDKARALTVIQYKSLSADSILQEAKDEKIIFDTFAVKEFYFYDLNLCRRRRMMGSLRNEFYSDCMIEGSKRYISDSALEMAMKFTKESQAALAKLKKQSTSEKIPLPYKSYYEKEYESSLILRAYMYFEYAELLTEKSLRERTEQVQIHLLDTALDYYGKAYRLLRKTSAVTRIDTSDTHHDNMLVYKLALAGNETNRIKGKVTDEGYYKKAKNIYDQASIDYPNSGVIILKLIALNLISLNTQTNLKPIDIGSRLSSIRSHFRDITNKQYAYKRPKGIFVKYNTADLMVICTDIQLGIHKFIDKKNVDSKIKMLSSYIDYICVMIKHLDLGKNQEEEYIRSEIKGEKFISDLVETFRLLISLYLSNKKIEETNNCCLKLIHLNMFTAEYLNSFVNDVFKAHERNKTLDEALQATAMAKISEDIEKKSQRQPKEKYTQLIEIQSKEAKEKDKEKEKRIAQEKLAQEKEEKEKAEKMKAEKSAKAKEEAQKAKEEAGKTKKEKLQKSIRDADSHCKEARVKQDSKDYSNAAKEYEAALKNFKDAADLSKKMRLDQPLLKNKRIKTAISLAQCYINSNDSGNTNKTYLQATQMLQGYAGLDQETLGQLEAIKKIVDAQKTEVLAQTQGVSVAVKSSVTQSEQTPAKLSATKSNPIPEKLAVTQLVSASKELSVAQLNPTAIPNSSISNPTQSTKTTTSKNNKRSKKTNQQKKASPSTTKIAELDKDETTPSQTKIELDAKIDLSTQTEDSHLKTTPRAKVNPSKPIQSKEELTAGLEKHRNNTARIIDRLKNKKEIAILAKNKLSVSSKNKATALAVSNIIPIVRLKQLYDLSTQFNVTLCGSLIFKLMMYYYHRDLADKIVIGDVDVVIESVPKQPSAGKNIINIADELNKIAINQKSTPNRFCTHYSGDLNPEKPKSAENHIDVTVTNPGYKATKKLIPITEGEAYFSNNPSEDSNDVSIPISFDQKNIVSSQKNVYLIVKHNPKLFESCRDLTFLLDVLPDPLSTDITGYFDRLYRAYFKVKDRSYFKKDVMKSVNPLTEKALSISWQLSYFTQKIYHENQAKTARHTPVSAIKEPTPASAKEIIQLIRRGDCKNPAIKTPFNVYFQAFLLHQDKEFKLSKQITMEADLLRTSKEKKIDIKANRMTDILLQYMNKIFPERANVNTHDIESRFIHARDYLMGMGECLLQESESIDLYVEKLVLSWATSQDYVKEDGDSLPEVVDSPLLLQVPMQSSSTPPLQFITPSLYGALPFEHRSDYWSFQPLSGFHTPSPPSAVSYPVSISASTPGVPTLFNARSAQQVSTTTQENQHRNKHRRNNDRNRNKHSTGK